MSNPNRAVVTIHERITYQGEFTFDELRELTNVPDEEVKVDPSLVPQAALYEDEARAVVEERLQDSQDVQGIRMSVEYQGRTYSEDNPDPRLNGKSDQEIADALVRVIRSSDTIRKIRGMEPVSKMLDAALHGFLDEDDAR